MAGPAAAAKTTRPRPMAPRKPATEAAAERLSRGKHERASEMLRELRRGAEALSANADRLLSRLTP